MVWNRRTRRPKPPGEFDTAKRTGNKFELESKVAPIQDWQTWLKPGALLRVTRPLGPMTSAGVKLGYSWLGRVIGPTSALVPQSSIAVYVGELCREKRLDKVAKRVDVTITHLFFTVAGCYIVDRKWFEPIEDESASDTDV